MTFSYNQVKEHPKLFLAMTGLTHAEFEQLLPHFQGALDQYVQENYIDRDKRQRQYGGGKPESTLITIEDKLLFILYYVKVYPLQEILAFEFDMVQSTAQRPCDAEKQKHYYSGKKKRIPSRISLLAVSIRAKSII